MKAFIILIYCVLMAYMGYTSKDETESIKENDFEVESILDERYNCVKKRKEWKVKWLNFPEDYCTWEPEENLENNEHLLAFFENKVKEHLKRKRHRKKFQKVVLSHDDKQQKNTLSNKLILSDDDEKQGSSEGEEKIATRTILADSESEEKIINHKDDIDGEFSTTLIKKQQMEWYYDLDEKDKSELITFMSQAIQNYHGFNQNVKLDMKEKFKLEAMQTQQLYLLMYTGDIDFEHSFDEKQFKNQTSSSYIGVSWNKNRKKWQAQLTHNSQKYNGGNFDNKDDAARKVNSLCDELGIQRKNPIVEQVTISSGLKEVEVVGNNNTELTAAAMLGSNLNQSQNEENQQNESKNEFKNQTSTYIGVYWKKQSKKWQAQLTHNSKKYHGGNFDNQEDAARKINLLCDEVGIPHKNPMSDAIQQKTQSSKKHESAKAENFVNEKEVKVEEENILYGLKDINPTINLNCNAIKQKRNSMEDNNEHENRFDENMNQCVFCFKDFDTNTTTTATLKCGHLFHYRCLALWIKNNRKCPISTCQVSIVKDLIKEIQENPEKMCEIIKNNILNFETMTDSEENTPLIWAAYLGQKKIVKPLIERKANVLHLNDDCATALMFAIGGNHYDIAKLLIQKDPFTLIQQDRFGMNALMQAVLLNHNVEFLFNTLPDNSYVCEAVNQNNNWGKTALMYAVKMNQIATVKALLQNGALVKDQTLLWKQTALMLAAHVGNEEIVKCLVEHDKTTVHQLDSNGWTALFYAANTKTDVHNIAQVLILNGALVTHQTLTWQQTALMIAAHIGNERIVKCLVKHDKTTINQVDGNGRTALFYAANTKTDSQNIVQFLILNGAQATHQTSLRKQTALMIAAQNGHEEIAKYLSKNEETVNQEDSDNVTPLQYAAQYNQLQIVKMLIEKGANIAHKDGKNRTALTHAPVNSETHTYLMNL